MLCHIRQEISVLGVCILHVLPNNVFCMYFRRQIDLRQYGALSNVFIWKQIPFLRGLNKIGDIQALFSAQVHYPQFATLNFWWFLFYWSIVTRTLYTCAHVTMRHTLLWTFPFKILPTVPTESQYLLDSTFLCWKRGGEGNMNRERGVVDVVRMLSEAPFGSCFWKARRCTSPTGPL